MVKEERLPPRAPRFTYNNISTEVRDANKDVQEFHEWKAKQATVNNASNGSHAEICQHEGFTDDIQLLSTHPIDNMKKIFSLPFSTPPSTTMDHMRWTSAHEAAMKNDDETNFHKKSSQESKYMEKYLIAKAMTQNRR